MSYSTEGIEVWNLTPGGTAVVGPQSHFNIVGHLRLWPTTERLSYRINGGEPRTVYFARKDDEDRLQKAGDFNIDTLEAEELDSENELTLEVLGKDGRCSRHALHFRLRRTLSTPASFVLDLASSQTPEALGQIVDGHWRIERDESGVACLTIRPEDMGYDRIILFGHHEWTTGYQVKARLSPTHFKGHIHNLGLLFRWNPHLRGTGDCLPAQWTTGLAYYYSECPGLRIRFGVDVHFDEHGVKQGDHVLAERHYSWFRRQMSRPPIRRLRRRILTEPPPSQLRTGQQYWFRLVVTPQTLALTVWEPEEPEPAPQLTVTERTDVIAKGSVGVIALNCAVRVYEYEVSAT